MFYLIDLYFTSYFAYVSALLFLFFLRIHIDFFFTILNI